jgi:hypothetical protein
MLFLRLMDLENFNQNLHGFYKADRARLVYRGVFFFEKKNLSRYPPCLAMEAPIVMAGLKAGRR